MADSLFRRAPISLVQAAPDGTVLAVNDMVLRVSGYDEHQLVGRSFLDFLHPDDRPAAEADLRRLASGAAEAKGVTLDVDAGPRCSLTADPHRLQQVVWNLLTNAIRATPRGGRVSTVVRTAPGRAEIFVRDTGEGTRGAEDGVRSPPPSQPSPRYGGSDWASPSHARSCTRTEVRSRCTVRDPDRAPRSR